MDAPISALLGALGRPAISKVAGAVALRKAASRVWRTAVKRTIETFVSSMHLLSQAEQRDVERHMASLFDYSFDSPDPSELLQWLSEVPSQSRGLTFVPEYIRKMFLTESGAFALDIEDPRLIEFVAAIRRNFQAELT